LSDFFITRFHTHLTCEASLLFEDLEVLDQIALQDLCESFARQDINLEEHHLSS
jgi:hypothetical protein